MAERLVIAGAGGFGREVVDVVDAINAAEPEPVWNLIGVVDDRPSEANIARLGRRGVPLLGSTEAYLALKTRSHYAIGIGSPAARRRLAGAFDAAGHSAAVLIHPTATRGFDVKVGPGSIICAGVRATTNIRLGRHVHLNPNVTVGHDTTLGDFVSVNPHASISGDCVLQEGVLVGVAGVILNGLTVGAGALVGGSACVVKNVPTGAVVKGVPAR